MIFIVYVGEKHRQRKCIRICLGKKQFSNYSRNYVND